MTNHSIISVTVFVFLISALSVTADVIKLNPSSTVTSKRVLLRDIAVIDGTDETVKQLGSIDIGYAPMPGKEKRIPASLVRSKVRSLFKNEHHQIIEPGSIISVKRASQRISDETLHGLYSDYIKRRFSGKTFKIRKMKIAGNRQLPTGKLSLRISEGKNTRKAGHIKLLVEAVPENGRIQRILVSGWVSLYEKLVRARHKLSKGSVIQQSDLYIEEADVTRYPSDVMYSTERITGQMAKRTIKKDSLIRSTMIGANPDIKKGETVKLVLRSGVLSVSALGIATENACVGEQVRVKNVQSRKIVTGQVLDSTNVRVLF